MHEASEPAHRVGRPGAFRSTGTARKVVITFSEILSALSFAIDLTEDAVPGHALRSCLLGMRLGQALGLSARELEPLYYALLLKDIGGSINASRLGQMARGDERLDERPNERPNERLDQRGAATDPRKTPSQGSHYAWERMDEERRGELARRQQFGRVLHMDARRRRSDREMLLLRCGRGANILRKLGLSAATCEAVLALDERWDGSGSPRRLHGGAIPLLARIVSLAEHLDAFACELTPAAAIAELRQRSGRWFDPELVEAVSALDSSGQLWTECLPADDLDVTRQLVVALDSKASNGVGAEQIDRICEAFADVVDAKSPFTYRHSLGVARVAVAMAAKLGLPPDRLRVVHRAALLHDLGKLSVPNSILDKTGRLTADEWHTVMEHPRRTQQILARIEPFAELAEIAGAHHEKLDGSGYPNGLRGPELRIESRVIAVADIYRALTEGRPYRPGASHAAAVRKLREMTPHQLDACCVEALEACCDPARATPAAALPGPVLERKRPAAVRAGRIYQTFTA